MDSLTIYRFCRIKCCFPTLYPTFISSKRHLFPASAAATTLGFLVNWTVGGSISYNFLTVAFRKLLHTCSFHLMQHPHLKCFWKACKAPRSDVCFPLSCHVLNPHQICYSSLCLCLFLFCLFHKGVHFPAFLFCWLCAGSNLFPAWCDFVYLCFS